MRKNDRFNSVQFIGRLSEFLTDTIEQELKKVGYPSLSASHFEILTYLIRKKDSQNMTNISEAIHRKKPTVTILVNKLESIGLVNKEISEEDKREYKVHLTKKGRGFRPIALRISSRVFSLSLWGVNEKESEDLYLLLEKVYLHTRKKL
ncbi:MarR family winged helix-turn-helix transcriptional regulator [Leptospira idonii]|uniref:MarR family transcriptional regulator n=1 Tax=Leptospira idonii TaxID=1193500 RepID=A0A4R9LWI0_9LEPT|nr:MarR family transcriptional regulator [Leptospira idonii]TGN18643.1 MarR family transcriptional regulator [Leptospira idonii]